MVQKADVVVIGAGPGGYVAAISCAQLGLKTVVVDNNAMLGGTCLRVGCIPSKTLLHATHIYDTLFRHGQELGIKASHLEYDFGQMMQKKEQVVATLARGVEALFRKNQITRLQGSATLKDPYTVQVNGEQIQTKHLILATGSEPISLPFLPFDEKRVLSSSGALFLSHPPKSLLLVGAGVVGLELGSVYRRLGCEVRVIELLDRVCPGLDGALSQGLQKQLTAQGMIFHLSSRVTQAQVKDNQVTLEVEMADHTSQTFTAEAVLVAVGRRPYSKGLGLEALAIEKDERGFIKVDGNLRTKYSHIYAIGDLVDGPMLAHKASEEGVAVAQLIFGKEAHVNYLALPIIVYTSPEAAGVGMTEEEALRHSLQIKTATFPFKANSRAHCVGHTEGFVKVIAEESTDRFIGMHLLCENGSEMVEIGVAALEQKMTVRQLADLPYAHPTFSEAIKEAALALVGKSIHI